MKHIVDQLVTVRLVKQADFPALTECAKADNHQVVAARWVVRKGEQIIGYIGLLPTVILWMDSKLARPSDCLIAMQVYENLLVPAGAPQTILAVGVSNESPLAPFVPRIGYSEVANTKLFIKLVGG